MTRSASPVSGLTAFSAFLVTVALTGCDGADPGPGASGVVQDALSLPTVCGGHGGHECSDDHVCVSLLSRACPGPAHAGLCVHRPEHCSKISDPVCGCDGKTYSNLCTAAAAGASIVHHGACAAAASCGPHAACPGAGTCTNGGASAHDDRDHDDHFLASFWHHGEPGAGSCECTAVGTCKAGERWNDSPSVCGCEANPDPCANVACKAGETCVVQNGAATCQSDPCSSVQCKAGQTCVVDASGAAVCQADPCATMSCKAPLVCAAQPDGTGACVASACAGVSCKAGQTCVIAANGAATCQ